MSSFEVGDIVKIRNGALQLGHELFNKPLKVVWLDYDRTSVNTNITSLWIITLNNSLFELIKKSDDNVFYKWLMYDE